MYKRILVATDGSALSDKAVRDAIGLAKMAGAELIALKVVVPVPVSYWEGSTRLDMQESANAEKRHLDAGRSIVEAVKTAGEAEGVSVTPLTFTGDLIAQTIIACAEKYECELIVMASHGRRGINRVLLGSETLQVLTHSRIPVLVLR